MTEDSVSIGTHNERRVPVPDPGNLYFNRIIRLCMSRRMLNGKNAAFR